jgi:hypothetical protein
LSHVLGTSPEAIFGIPFLLAAIGTRIYFVARSDDAIDGPATQRNLTLR